MIIILWKKDCYCCEQILKPTVAEKSAKNNDDSYAPLRNMGGSTLLCLDGKRLTIINHNINCVDVVFFDGSLSKSNSTSGLYGERYCQRMSFNIRYEKKLL